MKLLKNGKCTIGDSVDVLFGLYDLELRADCDVDCISFSLSKYKH